MTRKLRVRYENACYHVYNRGVEKRLIFLDDLDRSTFMKMLRTSLFDFGLKLFAYCLMDNHYHLFLQTPMANLDKGMQNLQGKYAQYFNLRHNRIGSLFQGRYKSKPVAKDNYALELVRYIHRNPSDNQNDSRWLKYRWSSYLDYITSQPAVPYLDTEWVLKQFHQDSQSAAHLFIDFHNQGPGGSGPFGIFDMAGKL